MGGGCKEGAGGGGFYLSYLARKKEREGWFLRIESSLPGWCDCLQGVAGADGDDGIDGTPGEQVGTLCDSVRSCDVM